MKRNITSTIEFSKDLISFHVIEQLLTNKVELFSASASLKKANSFLKDSLEKTSKIIGGNIKDVIVVVEPSSKVAAKIELVKKRVLIQNSVVSKKDINNLINLVSSEYRDENRKIILIQPLQFEVENIVKKQYFEAPIAKEGDFISATMAMTTINANVVKFINNITDLHFLKINQILTTAQTISQTHLSETAVKKGAILIHIDENQSFVSINKNGGTIATLLLYDVGYNHLIKTIIKNFGCTYKEAQDLVLIYGSFKKQVNQRVAYIKNEGINEVQFTFQDLHVIVERYFSRLFSVVSQFINQKKVVNLPVVISGKIVDFKEMLEFSKTIFQNPISIYKPINYLEINQSNVNIIGVININKRLDGVFGKKLVSIVETNPNHFNSFKKQHSKSFVSKLLRKLGGNYGWRN